MTERSVERDCPVDECEGQIVYWEMEGENGPYADGSYQYWTFLQMDEPPQCSEGHQFSPEEVDRMERKETDDYQHSYYWDEP